MEDNPIDEKYLLDFQNQTNCDLTFVCLDGEIGGHSKILNDKIEYLKTQAHFYSSSGQDNADQKVHLDQKVKLVKDFLGVFYGLSCKINTVNDCEPYIFLANYLLSDFFLEYLVQSFKGLILNNLRDKNMRWIAIYKYWLEHNNGHDHGLNNAIQGYFYKNPDAFTWALKKANLPSQIAMMIRLDFTNYYIQKLTDNTLQIRTLTQIVNQDEKNETLSYVLANLLHFLPTEYWLNVCEYQDDSLEYLAYIHEKHFPNSANVVLRKKWGLPLSENQTLNPLEIKLLKLDGYLDDDDISSIKVDDSSTLNFKLSDTKEDTKEDTKDIFLNLVEGTFKEYTDITQEDLPKITVNNNIIILEWNGKTLKLKPEIVYGKFEYDNNLLKFIRDKFKLEFYGSKNTSKTSHGYYSYTHITPTSSLVLDLTNLKTKSQIIEKYLEILLVPNELGRSNYGYSKLHQSFIKLRVPLKDFDLKRETPVDLSYYLHGIGSCLENENYNRNRVIVNTKYDVNFGWDDEIILKHKKGMIKIFRADKSDRFGYYKQVKGQLGTALKGISSHLSPTHHFVTLKKSSKISLRISNPGVNKEFIDNISKKVVKKFQIIANAKTFKSEYSLETYNQSITFEGAYCILFDAYNNSPDDTGYNVYFINLFNPKKMHHEKYPTVSYYDKIVRLN